MKRLMMRWLVPVLLAALYPLVQAASPPAFSTASAGAAPAPWRVIGLPERYAKPVTQFDITELAGSKVLRIRADQSWGTLAVGSTPPEPISPQTTLKWRWRLDQALPQADLSRKATEDAALKVCVSFDMPADSIPSGERTLFKLAQFFTRDKIPTATLCYVWSRIEAIGHAQASPVTNRVRYVVLANASTALQTWHSQERNLHADFLKAFGHEAVIVPARSAIVLGADSDNTAASSLGYVGDVQVSP
jgi:Protein of unknown function (DUF3047)